MAYVNVADWKPDQVTDWLKGLDSAISPYIQSFLNNHVTGQQLLNLGPDDLEHLGIIKIGLQEIILEGVEHLRNIHYELDRENLQLLAMRLSCLAHSLHNELYHCDADTQRLCPQILADIANIVSAVKPLIAWLDRPGFQGELDYAEKRRSVLCVALNMATCGQRDRFAEAPSLQMREASAQLAKLADVIVREIQDPLILQPASLDLATIKKRSSDDLGFYIVPSSRRVHQISELKLNSAAHQSGKIEPGDEIVQINYQTVVGWEVKHVMGLFAECPTEVLLTLKKRPRHTKVYGQIYVKPYRLPSKKRSPHPFSTRHLHLTPLRIHLQPLNKLGSSLSRKIEEEKQESRLSSSSDEEVTVQHHNLGVSANPVHRRATITGASPLSKRPPFDIRELWHDLKLEKESAGKKSTSSVIDFEDRLNSSSFVKDEPAEMETKDISPKSAPPQTDGTMSFESLSIKQRIKLFSGNEEDRTKPKPINRPLKPARVASSIPAFEENILKQSTKVKCEEKDISQFVIKDDVKKSNETVPQNFSSKPESSVYNTNCSDDIKMRSNEVNVIVGQGCNILSPESNTDSDKSTNSTEANEICNISLPSRTSTESFTSTSQEFRKGKPVIIEDQAIVKEKLDIPINNFKDDRQDFIMNNRQAGISKCTSIKIPVRQNSKESLPSPPNTGESSVSIRNQISDKTAVSIKNNLQQTEQKPLNNKIITDQYASGPSRLDFYSPQQEKESNLIVNYPVHYLSKELNDNKREKVADESNVEHGRVVETINRHLLDNLSDYSDFNCGELETLSGSLPHHGRLRKGIVFDDNRPEMLTNSLPLLKKNLQQQREFASELSRTISQVCRDDVSVSERGYDPNDYGFPVWQCTNEPFQRSPQISESKQYSSGESLNKKAEKQELNRSFTSLHDWVPRDTSSETSSCKSLSSDFASDATRNRPQESSQDPPLPPPRPSLSKPPSACYRAIIAARSIGKASPKAQRKKNPLLAKGRKISVKELSRRECEGWLQQRCRKGSSCWKRRWCLISSNTLYTYVSKQSEKAETMICLPGFTVSPAEEVKSRLFAFKVYHDGTSFYFAADSYMEFSYWLDAITVSTLAQSSHSREIAFSESEGEEDNKQVVVPIPAPRQNPPPPPQQSQQPAHSLASELPKKFGSLKKLACRGSSSSESKDKDKSGGSSLDRKCRRLLGVGTAQPVPTPQYRSYRRVHHTPPPPPSYSSMGQVKEAHQTSPPQDMADYRQTSYQPKTPPIPSRRRTVAVAPDPPSVPPLPHSIGEHWDSEPNTSLANTSNPPNTRHLLPESISRFHYRKKTKKPSQPPQPFLRSQLYRGFESLPCTQDSLSAYPTIHRNINHPPVDEWKKSLWHVRNNSHLN